jgi:ethanolamine ammonia-lyase small subunit
MDRFLIEKIVKEVLLRIFYEQGYPWNFDNKYVAENISDITTEDITNWDFVKGAHSREFAALRSHTPARLAVGKTGLRYLLHTQLRFLADHAAAKDAVESEITEEFAQKYNLEIFTSKCSDHMEHITRPDLGKQLTKETLSAIKALNSSPADISIYIADGLSAKAVMEHGMNTLLTAKADLETAGLRVAQPFIIRNGRVGTMDVVSETLKTPVTCVLIGERPGLGVADSMSAYAAYNATVGMGESHRTVISNIHKKGTPAIEAGAWLSELLFAMLRLKLSGVELRDAQNMEARR